MPSRSASSQEAARVPLTVAEDSESVLRIVCGIAEQIDAAVFTDVWRSEASEERPSGELATREAGVAVLFTELASLTGEARFASSARRLLAAAAHRLENVEMGWGLFSGASGVAWATHHASVRNVLDTKAGDDADPASDLDLMLLDHVRASSYVGTDIISGMAGIGTYVLSRLPRETACRTLEALCERLRSESEPVSGGRAWSGNGDYGAIESPPFGADGAMPIGLAHGLAGVVGFLSRVVDRGYDFGAADLLTGAGDALVATATNRTTCPVSPRMMDRRGTMWGAPSLTWCWGDVGVALAAIHSGITMGRQDWIDYGVRLARGAAEESLHGTVRDPSLCHGLAGSCHAFRAIGSMTGDVRYRVVANRCRDVLLATRGGTGYGGFKFFLMAEDGSLRPAPSVGLLTGSSGVGLALLSSCTKREPLWDALFQMDAPRRRYSIAS